MKTPLTYHRDYAGYDFGANHPFRGDRFARFVKELKERFPDVYSSLEIIEPEPAPFEMILKAHAPQYVERVNLLEKRRGYLSIDTQVLPGSVEAARLIVGGTIATVRAALERGLALGFGGLHHAGPNYGEGFCIFNDVAVASAVLLEEKVEKIMIIDTDAHQGNGTMEGHGVHRKHPDADALDRGDVYACNEQHRIPPSRGIQTRHHHKEWRERSPLYRYVDQSGS